VIPSLWTGSAAAAAADNRQRDDGLLCVAGGASITSRSRRLQEQSASPSLKNGVVSADHITCQQQQVVASVSLLDAVSRSQSPALRPDSTVMSEERTATGPDSPSAHPRSSTEDGSRSSQKVSGNTEGHCSETSNQPASTGQHQQQPPLRPALWNPFLADKPPTAVHVGSYGEPVLTEISPESGKSAAINREYDRSFTSLVAREQTLGGTAPHQLLGKRPRDEHFSDRSTVATMNDVTSKKKVRLSLASDRLGTGAVQEGLKVSATVQSPSSSTVEVGSVSPGCHHDDVIPVVSQPAAKDAVRNRAGRACTPDSSCCDQTTSPSCQSGGGSGIKHCSVAATDSDSSNGGVGTGMTDVPCPPQLVNLVSQ
jgi:hypothetical protein